MRIVSRALLLVSVLLVCGGASDQDNQSLRVTTAPRSDLSGHSLLLLEPPGNPAEAIDSVFTSLGIHAATLSGQPSWTNTWEWRKDPAADGEIKGWAFSNETAGWQSIEVGRSWHYLGQRYEGVAWYRRSFDWQAGSPLPPAMVFRKMEDSLAVYVNGIYLGRGGGNWGDVQVALEHLLPGRNDLQVRVTNPPHAGDPGRAGLVGETDLSVALPEATDLLSQYDMIMLSSRLLLSRQAAFSLAEYVRRGGGLLVLFHDDVKHWIELPIEEILPTFLGFPYSSVGMVRPVPTDSSTAGLGLEASPPVELNAGIDLPMHPRFARPGTQETSRWNLSPLASGHGVLIKANDPRGSPLLTRCSFGAGEVLACASPGLFLQPEARALLETMVQRLSQTRGTSDPPLAKIWGCGRLPWGKMIRMGLEPVEDHEADLFVIGEASPTAVAALDSALFSGKSVLVTAPEIFQTRPSPDPWEPASSRYPPPIPLSDDETWQRRLEHAGPWVHTVPLPPDLRESQICIDGERFGAVRALWADDRYGKPCADGSWTVIPAAGAGKVRVGIWGMAGASIPLVHFGDKAILVTSTGFRLAQPFHRPSAREALETVLWSWEDGSPAVAMKRVGRSKVASVADMLEWHNPRALDWSDVQASKQRFLCEDSSQLIAWMAREISVDERFLPGDFVPGEEGVSIRIHPDPAGASSLLVRARFRDWQRSLISTIEMPIITSPKKTFPLLIPWPDPQEMMVYRAAEHEFLWLELAVLSSSGSRCLAWAEKRIERPGPTLHVWHTPVQLRTPPREPATWPRFRDHTFPSGWSPASQYPLFLPGEKATLYVERWAPGEDKHPELRLQELRTGTPRSLTPKSARKAPWPWGIDTWEFVPHDSFGVYRAEATLNGAFASRSFIVQGKNDGFRNVIWDKHKGVQVLGTLFPHMNAVEFARENLAADPVKGLAWGPFYHSWPGQPWCNFHPNPFTFLPNGIHYREWLAPAIRDLSRHVWTGERMIVSASLVDGFNGVVWPAAAVHPQHLDLFVPWMEQEFGMDFAGVSIDSLARLAQGALDPYWRFFVATEIALPAHEIFKKELQAPSPASQVTDQFDLPQLPTLLKIPEIERFASRWQAVFDISSMDAWNVRAGRDFRAATYLVCLGKALAPAAKVGHFHMEMLGGDGPERISKAERIRRQNADAFWMMVAGPEGSWIPVFDYPNGGGVSWLGGWETWLPLCSRGIRGGHVAFAEDWWILEQLYALAEAVRPQRPRGFALAAVGPRFPEPGEDQVIIGDQARLFSMLRETGLPISALARLDLLNKHTLLDGLIVPVPGRLHEREQQALSECLRQGVTIGLVGCGLSDLTLSQYTGIPVRQLSSGTVPVLRRGNVRGPFWDEGSPEEYAQLSEFAAELQKRCRFRVTAPKGVAWYAFERGTDLVLIVEDTEGASRPISLELFSPLHPTRAIELFEAKTLRIEQMAKGFRLHIPACPTGARIILIEGAS